MTAHFFNNGQKFVDDTGEEKRKRKQQQHYYIHVFFHCEDEC